MVRRRPIAVSKQRKLLNRAKEVAVQVGAVPTPDGLYQFQLQTTVGLLRISFSEGHELASVFCRFDEPERAVELISRHEINPFSGKWNHHWGRDADPELALLSFKTALDRLTGKDPCT